MWNEISVLIGKELRCEWVINLERPIHTVYTLDDHV